MSSLRPTLQSAQRRPSSTQRRLPSVAWEVSCNTKVNSNNKEEGVVTSTFLTPFETILPQDIFNSSKQQRIPLQSTGYAATSMGAVAFRNSKTGKITMLPPVFVNQLTYSSNDGCLHHSYEYPPSGLHCRPVPYPAELTQKARTLFS